MRTQKLLKITRRPIKIIVKWIGWEKQHFISQYTLITWTYLFYWYLRYRRRQITDTDCLFCISTAMRGNLPSDMCAQRRFRSDCAFAQSDQNLHWARFGLPRMDSFLIRITKLPIRLRACAGWFGSSTTANVRRYVFPLWLILCGKHFRRYEHKLLTILNKPEGTRENTISCSVSYQTTSFMSILV